MSFASVKDVLRLLCAGLFVCAGMCVFVVMFTTIFPNVTTFWILGPPVVTLFFLLVLASIRIFDGKLSRQASAERRVAHLRELEERGLVSNREFVALRAFQVVELEDEGSSYFIELEDSAVLFLTGQYLYDYEPYQPRKGNPQLRSFPSTRFTIRRHKNENYVLVVLCLGETLEPEFLAQHFTLDDFKSGRVPDDGAILRDKSFDEIKFEYSKPR